MSGANAIGTPGEQAPDGAQVLAGVDENGALVVPMVTTRSPPAGAPRIAVHVTNLGGGVVPGGATEATLQDILADTAQLPVDPASDTAVAAVEAAVAAVEGHLPAQVASEATLGTLGTEATLDLVRVAAQALVTALGSPAGGAAGATALAAVKAATEGLQTALGSPAGGVAGATALASAVTALQAIQAAIGSPAGGAAGATALASLLTAAQAIQTLQGGGLPVTLDGGALRVHEQGLGETPTREVGRVTTTGSATIATETTAQAILADTAQIPADPAREGGHLAAIDTSTARIPASPATETGHLATIDTSTATAVVTLASILAKISADPATQTTLAAVLSALGAQATATKQDTLAGIVATAARQDSGNTSVATIAARTPPLGQAAMAASTPVVIASDQSTVNVDTSLPAFTANDPGIVSFPAAAKSTFGQLAVVSPYGLFSEDFRFGVDSTIWAATATGGAFLRHLPNLSAVRLEVSGASQVARIRSQYPIAYQRGRMHDVIATGFSSSTAALSIGRRSSVTGSAIDALIAQVAWAGVLDGSFTPPAWDKANIFEFGFNWLGVGPERMLINTLLAHTINTPGQLAAPWAATAVLPVTAELQTDEGGNWTLRIGYFDDLDGLFYQQTGSGAATFTFMCSSVSSVGGHDPRLQARGFASVGNNINLTTEVPLFALRPATTWAATNATITDVTAAANRTQFWPRRTRVTSNTAAIDIYVYLNPTTLTGGSWVSAGTDSAAEINLTATAFTGGTRIGTGASLSASYGEIDIEDNFSPVARRFGVRYDGNRDTLLVTAAKQSGGGGATQCQATTVWGELR